MEWQRYEDSEGGFWKSENGYRVDGPVPEWHPHEHIHGKYLLSTPSPLGPGCYRGIDETFDTLGEAKKAAWNEEHWRLADEARAAARPLHSVWEPKRPPTETLRLIAEAAWDLNRYLPDDLDGWVAERFEEIEGYLSERIAEVVR